MLKEIFVFSIAALSIILGFIALLTQKIYLDPDTKQPTTEVEIPFLGKLKTNIPALVFVFFGIALAGFAFDKVSSVKKVEWNLIGQFRNVGDQQIDWNRGTLTVIPRVIKTEVSRQGAFRIDAKIDEGKTIEDVIHCIIYSHAIGSAQIVLKKEYEAHCNKEETLIETAEKNFRKYKPASILYYPMEDNQ